MERCKLCGKDSHDFVGFRNPQMEGGRIDFWAKFHLYIGANAEWVFGVCSECGTEINQKLEEIEKVMQEIFQNRVWREVDKVYETRWDCLNMRLVAA